MVQKVDYYALIHQFTISISTNSIPIHSFLKSFLVVASSSAKETKSAKSSFRASN